MKNINLFLLFLALCMPFSVFAQDDYDDDGEIGSTDNGDNAVTILGYKGLSTDPGEEGLTYHLGVRDWIAVEIFQVEELNHEARVNTEGFISLPLIGNLKVAGLTAEETERLIEKKLGENFLQDPRVTIFVKEYESQKITVEGFVRSPGIYSLTGKTTVLQAIAMAKGALRLADQKKIVVFRTVADNRVVGYKIDVKKIRTGEIKDPFVQNKDIIVVPKHGGRGAVDEWQRLTSGIPLL